MTSAKQQRLFAEFDDDSLEAAKENLSDQAKLDLQLDSELETRQCFSALGCVDFIPALLHSLVLQLFQAFSSNIGIHQPGYFSNTSSHFFDGV